MQTSPTTNNNYAGNNHIDAKNCDGLPDPYGNTNIQHASLCFADGVRSIDFVLVWKPVEEKVQEDLNCTKREIFEDNLVNEGLELERETVEQIHFTKIHTPIEVLRRYCEILKLRMPMKEVRSIAIQFEIALGSKLFSYFSHCVQFMSKIDILKYQTPQFLSQIRSENTILSGVTLCFFDSLFACCFSRFIEVMNNFSIFLISLMLLFIYILRIGCDQLKLQHLE